MGNICFKDQNYNYEINNSKAITTLSNYQVTNRIYDIEDNKISQQNVQISNKNNHNSQIENKFNDQNEQKADQKNEQSLNNNLQSIINNAQEDQFNQDGQSDHEKSNRSQSILKNEISTSINKSRDLQNFEEQQKVIQNEQQFQKILKKELNPQIYFINLLIPTKLTNQQVEVINLYLLSNKKYLLKKIYLQQIIFELPQSDSYLIQRLQQSFDENRNTLNRATLEYSNIIQRFLQEYYFIVQNQLQWQDSSHMDNSFKFCQFMFENESIIYSKYFDQKSQTYFNVYKFLNENDFQNSFISCQVAKSHSSFSSLIANIFCDPIQFDQQKELIFEESFDFNFNQFIDLMNPNIEEHNLQCILLQLIDICLLFDELEVYYNQFDQYHVGFIYQNQKLFVKLRKIFILKKDYQQYILRSKFINEYINVYDKQHILFYEICNVLELVEQMIEDENQIFREIITQFISNQEFFKNGVCQKQVVEFFQFFIGDQVLQHYPAINMYKLELYMKDLKFIYSHNLIYLHENELLDKNNLLCGFFIIEHKESYQNNFFCNTNLLIVWIIGVDNENLIQIEEYLTELSLKYDKKYWQVLTYVLKFLILTDYKPRKLSRNIIDDKIKGTLKKKNVQQREKYKQAVKNVSQLLYIDIAPLLLDDLGLTKECLVQPFSNKFQFEIKFEDLDQSLCRYVERYLNKTIHIDFQNLLVYTTNSGFDLVNLQHMYARNMIQISEQKVKEILTQIFKITLLLFENKYYICKFNLDCFSLHESKSYKNKFYLKYNDILSITNNLALSISELVNNNIIFGLRYYDMEFEVSEQFYLKLSILQICQQITCIMLNNYNYIAQTDKDSFKDIDKLRNIYSKQLIEFFEKSINRTKNFSKQQLYQELQTLFPYWKLSEKKQLINLTEMEQNILNQKIKFQNNYQYGEEIFQQQRLDTYLSRQQIEDVLKNIKKVEFTQNNQEFSELFKQKCHIYFQITLLSSVSRILYLNNSKVDDNLLQNLPYKIFNGSLFKQQVICMNKILNGQKAEQNLKNLENLHKYKFFLEVEDSCPVKEPQFFLQFYAQNIAEFLLSKNENLIEYYSSIDLNLNVQNSKQNNEEDYYFAEFQKYKNLNKSTFDLFQGKEKQLINKQNDQGITYLNQNTQPTNEQNTQIISKEIQENVLYLNTILQIQNHRLIQKEQETQEYKLMFENYQKENEDNKLNEQIVTIQAFKNVEKPVFQIDEDLKSNERNINNSDEQTKSYKILNELLIVLNDQKKLDKEQKQLSELQIGINPQNQSQYNLDQSNNINCQMNRKLNDDQKEEIFNQSQIQSLNKNNLSKNNVQDQENNFLKTQSLILKKSNNLLKIGHLGKGGQACVEFYYDFMEKKRYALKNFKNKNEYLQEKMTHINYLLEDKNLKLSSYVCQLVSFDDQDCQILLEVGICSLQDAYINLKNNNLKPSINYFVNILVQIISFNIQMNKAGLYHSDIKPQNMVLYLDQNEQSVQHQFGFCLVNFQQIQLKFIDFASCSDDPKYYYAYQTPKYKYYGYQKQDLDFKKILFAETYSACRSIYFLLDEKLQQKRITISSDNQFQGESEENNLLFFLQMFLGDNQEDNNLSRMGISVDELTSLTERYLGKINEHNKNFKCDFLNVLQIGQWQNINEIDSTSNNSSIEYQIFKAFAFINKLNKIFSKENNQSQILEQKNVCINNLLQCLEIIVMYQNISDYQLSFILKIYACFFYCHSEKDYYKQLIKTIIKTKIYLNFKEESAQILEIVQDVFLSIIAEVNVDPLELIEKIYLLEIEVQQQHSLLYEFIITYILEQLNEFDEQAAFIMLNILEKIKSSKNLNIFQLKVFNHVYLYFLHLTIQEEHKQYSQKFYDYKQICRDLNLILEQDTIIFQNYHIIKTDIRELEEVAINLEQFSSSMLNSDKKLDKILKSIAQNQDLENKENYFLHYFGIKTFAQNFI
ncbi:hypothetical protein ABPG72_010275 [Tetrahymena utriculariae]